MCGIVGKMDLGQGNRVSASEIESMCDAIIHRGPDDSGVHIEGQVGLGMRRLSIIDITSGHQPIANEDDSIWIVFNGEIYNHDNLRSKLLDAGHKFRTQSDTEVILHLYEQKGIHCLQDLRGMFAFAIWDRPRGRLFIARDFLGIKPLFWTTSGGFLSFGSEMKSLLTLPHVQNKINWNGFDAYFTYTYIPAPLTIYDSINKLPAGHFMTAENGKVSIQRYWDIDFSNKFTCSDEEIQDGFVDLFEDAVRIRLMSEVPLGSFLSGGLDSGLIVALMSRAANSPVNTFTIGFGGDTGSFLDERPYAREIAEQYKCSHNEFEVLPRVEEAIDAGITAFDEPFADDSIIPTFHICEEARKHVTVVLTGLGGDENFAGYERYLGFQMSHLYEKVPLFLREKIVKPFVNCLREERGGHYRINHLKRFVAGGSLPAAQRWQSYTRTMTPEQRFALYSPEIIDMIDFEYVEQLGWEHFERLPEGDNLDRALYQDLNTYLPEDILALSDRVGMHHSLELRVPFVDHKLVEYCARIPNRLKINRREKKYLLKSVANDFLPKSVINHRKQGFCAPMAAWLRGPLKETVEQHLFGQDTQSKGLFRPEALRKLVDDHMAFSSLNDKILFSLLVFQKWQAQENRLG